MKAIIRIKGMTKLNKEVSETLDRLCLRRKYSCVIINETKENLGMIKRVRDFVAYGDLDDKTLKLILEKRSQPIDKKVKIDLEKAFSGIKEGKDMREFNLKPFFRLHPPRKGIDSKLHFGIKKGVLGDNKESINKLIEKMV